ncbi:NTP transferase domain-containing protein [bacterium]|nr:NTP transferase domain-containing protein [bacterium]
MNNHVSKAIILAAGVGSRLAPLTNSIPKPIIPIVNVPIMDFLLTRLANVGIKDVIANTHYHADKIINRYSTNSLGINFNYIHEQTLSGTAGGVKKCQKFFNPNEPVSVLSADGLSNVNFDELINSHIKSGAIATMGIKQIPQEEIPKFGVVVKDENCFVKEFQEKPSLKEAKSDFINTGIYVFNYEIFNFIPENTFYDFGKNVFQDLLDNNMKINTYNLSEYWSDIGSIEQYIASSWDLYDGKIEGLKGNPMPQQYTFKGKRNIIGKNCKISHDATLENCILGDNVQIPSAISLKDCIVTSNTTVTASATNQIIDTETVLSV